MGKEEFTYISTFAGCGGSSLGYKWAGGRGLAAVEFDANAVATYRANFPDTPIIDRDICKVTAEELMEVAGICVGELDILDGSPPCQGFSTAGKRVITDPRNSLFVEFVRLIEGLQPRVFVMENVSGMVKGKMKLVFREVMLALKSTGYRVRCKLLNAMYFNVPQSRERLIWIGVRKDVERPPSFPKAQSKPQSVEDALGVSGCINYRHNYSVGQVHWKRHPFTRPCLTITKTGRGWKTTIDGEERPFKLSELKTLASFPADFKFTDERNGWERIGNCVPPRFAQAIAEHIRDEILEA